MTSTHVDRSGATALDDELADRPAAPAEEDRRPAEVVPGPRPGRFRPRVTASRIALLLVVLLAGGLVGLHIHRYQQLSVYDEAQHVDYVYHLLRGEVPKAGDHWLPPTVDSVACRTIDYPMDRYPTCGGPATSDVLPNGGLTTAFGHTPLYYLAPVGAAWISDHVLAGHLDPVTAMRTTGALWLAVALLLMWLVWRDLRVPWPVRAATLIALVASPVVLLTQGAVTNDATQLAAGAAITLAALRWDQRRLPTWAAVLVAAVVVALKDTSLAILIMACLFVLVRRLQEHGVARPRWWRTFDRRTLTFVGLSAAAFAVVSVGWSAIQESRATMDQRLIPQNVITTVHSFDVSWLPASLMSVTTPLQPQFLQSALRSTVGSTAGNMVNVGLLVLAVVGAVRSRPGSVVRALAIATGIAMLVFGPLLTVIIYVSASTHFGLPARYGLSLVPAIATVAATAVRSRWGQVAFVAVALVMYAAVAVHLLG
jgi:hypothetical protein